MKVILLQEVTGLGEPGDVVEVKDGYARNYLVPRNFATRWTRGGEREVASIRRAREARQVRDLGQADELKARLEGLTVRLPVRAGDSGRLFGAVTPADIASAVQLAGVDVDRRRIELGAPIKALGQHEVAVRLHPEVTARIRLDVVAA